MARNGTIYCTVRTETSRWFGLSRVVRLLPFILFICGVLATLMLQDVLTHRDRAQLEARTESEARHVSAQVRVGVLQALILSHGSRSGG